MWFVTERVRELASGQPLVHNDTGTDPDRGA